MEFTDAQWFSYIKEKNNYHSFNSDYSCIIPEFQKWDIGHMVYVTVARGWWAMGLDALECNLLQKSMLFSN